jgi:dolichol-phosphate mannosyltransferase
MRQSPVFSRDLVISIVAPVYNEEKGIHTFIAECLSVVIKMKVNYELVLVNDGSRDKSLGVMAAEARKNKNIRVVDLSRNYGREIAMTAGLDQSIGDYVVLMDSDMQDPPALIPELLAKCLADDLDVVYAARTSRHGESFLKKLTSRLFYRLARNMTGLQIPENAGDFRIFSRRVVNAVTSMKEHNRYLKMLYGYVGYRVGSIPFERQARLTGTSSYNWVKLINAALDAIIAFSNKPLRIVSISSMGLSFLLLAYSLYVLIEKLLGGKAVEGWTSLMIMISLMFSMLFIFLAVIGEYVGRIMVESKNRPLYYIRDEVGGTQFDVAHMVQDAD